MNITSQEELRTYFGEPSHMAKTKEMTRIDDFCRRFIALSPFLVISSAAADGTADASPKGDAPGFVAVLDDTTLLIPDRPGNNRVDTMQNILANPYVGLLFLVPGMNETLRVNGRANITTEASLLEPLAVRGKTPRSGIRIEVRQVFFHCAKALIRSNLWDPDTRIDRKSFPTMGELMAGKRGGDPEEYEKDYQERNRTRLY